jgi:hypothetical protein
MITIKDIIDGSKPHPLDGGKMTRLYNDEIEFSIVGGRSGLYGDFENDFEVAILDRKTGDFRTRFFKPELSDDVVGYMPKNDVVEFLNQILGKSFQVR